jgi:hypothetical protein
MISFVIAHTQFPFSVICMFSSHCHYFAGSVFLLGTFEAIMILLDRLEILITEEPNNRTRPFTKGYQLVVYIQSI